jgi:hypothetical protein
MESIVVYHGSISKITKPIFGEGKERNDYGRGFYCTQDIELAKEWAAVENDSIGFVNKYEINLSKLKVLDLTTKEHSALNWIAILVRHRIFDTNSEVAKKAKDFLISKYYIDISKYDVVIGYRADDSYFRYAKDFLNNTISVQQLSKAMELGNLGLQVVLISEKAFNLISFIGFEEVNSRVYYKKRKARDEEARKSYFSLDSSLNKENDYIIDIMRKETNYEH